MPAIEEFIQWDDRRREDYYKIQLYVKSREEFEIFTEKYNAYFLSEVRRQLEDKLSTEDCDKIYYYMRWGDWLKPYIEIHIPFGLDFRQIPAEVLGVRLKLRLLDVPEKAFVVVIVSYNYKGLRDTELDGAFRRVHRLMKELWDEPALELDEFRQLWQQFRIPNPVKVVEVRSQSEALFKRLRFLARGIPSEVKLRDKTPLFSLQKVDPLLLQPQIDLKKLF